MNTNHPHRPDARETRCAQLLAAACALFLAVTAWAAPRGKVELCHLPPDNPVNTQTISVDEPDVDDHLAHGDFLGACPLTAAELDPPVVTVDEDLGPPAPSIAGVDDGPPRPLARLHATVGGGYDFDFVANEVYLVTDDPADLADFQSRWPSELLRTIELPPAGPGGAATRIYLLAVDASMVNTNRLDKDLALLSPKLHGAHQVSSDAALKLLALVAGEIRREGLRVGLNALLRSQDLGDRQSVDAMNGDSVPAHIPIFDYTTNAFDWPYLERNPRVPGTSAWPSDTGTADAVRVVEAAGRLGNRVRTMIVDGGFFPNADFPEFTMFGPVRTVNPDPGGCGSGSPATLSDACGTHGTQVVMAGFAKPDNAFGGFGPGGAVSELSLVQAPSIDLVSMSYFLIDSIPGAVSERPRIINISASTDVAAGWCFIVCEPLDLVGQWLHDNGIVFVAAAGNQKRDVDALDEFCIVDECIEFEEAAIIPCELDHVVCVGAYNFLSAQRAAYSNYGTIHDDNSVDIFAPGNIYSVDAIMADSTVGFSDDLHINTGTSYASPFMAGVFALTWAANPSLTVSQLQACVLGNAHVESPTGDRRRVDALGAVSCALGGTHPWVGVHLPREADRFERGVEDVVLVADSDDYEDVKAGGAPTIYWTSSLDGDLGATSDEGRRVVDSLELSVGTHDICAQATDSSSRWWQDCVEIAVVSASPNLELVLPGVDSDSFYEGEPIRLVALASDPDGPEPTVEWRSSFYTGRAWDEMGTLAFGEDVTIDMPAWMVAGRSYTLRVRATDDTGAYAEAGRTIHITTPPGNLSPTITVEQPTQGATFESEDGGPVEIVLVASAEDPEDGPIDFENISWFVSVEGGGTERLAVTRKCLLYELGDSSVCRIYGPWTFELAPQASNTISRFEIRGVVGDSNDNFGRTMLVVFVTQVII